MPKLQRMFLCAAAIFTLFSTGVATAKEPCGIKNIDIYFFDWLMPTRQALTPENVRSMYNTKITTRSEDFVKSIIGVIDYNKFEHPSSSNVKSDVRLVIDITNCEENIVTIIADNFKIYDTNLMKFRQNTREFRDYFDRLAQNKETPAR